MNSQLISNDQNLPGEAWRGLLFQVIECDLWLGLHEVNPLTRKANHAFC